MYQNARNQLKINVIFVLKTIVPLTSLDVVQKKCVKSVTKIGFVTHPGAHFVIKI
jgi:hypothetical protein